MSNRSRLVWRPRYPRCPDFGLLRPWLFDRGSLTARLQTKGDFALHVIKQGLSKPTMDEAITLCINRKAWVRTREVVLFCNEIPVVFAHTILPCFPRGPMTLWLRRIGDDSLGAMLFSHAGFSRGEIQCKRLDRRHILFQTAIQALQLTGDPPSNVWARRSRFLFDQQSILVTEIFSPILWQEPSGTENSMRRQNLDKGA